MADKAESPDISAAKAGTKTDIMQIDETLAKTRTEVSAATIARMMGVATATDVSLLEGKIDLAVSKINSVTVKLEKVLSMLNNAPTGSDLERIDVQIGALRTLVRDMLAQIVGQDSPAPKVVETPKTETNSTAEDK